jgi:hypothetical protein
MAAIAASNVTYTQQSLEIQDKYRQNVFKVEFGDGALTYPAGGVPLDKNKLGTPNELRQLTLMDSEDADGFVYKWDFENNKIRIYQGYNDAVADGPLVELGGAATPAATDLYVRVEGW